MPTIVLHKTTNRRYLQRALSILLSVCIVLGLAACSKDDPSALNDEDKARIIRTATDYYKKVEAGNYAYVLDFLSIPDARISIPTKLAAMKDLQQRLGYRIEWDEPFLEGDVAYHTEMKMPFVFTTITVHYDGVIGGTINEILYFRKIEERWYIAHIESLDRFVPYRAPDYTVGPTPHFLLPDR
ncbi:hypothetical protein MO973_43565 [Paenibacillus sp. TRM 82003]|nr:hypothetical protein [Paenibacillus sp. TRM 82003]